MALKIVKGDKARIDETVKIIGNGTLILGDKAQIRAYTVIEMDGDLTIGSGSVIGYHNFIQCTGTITIGNGTLIGPNTVLLASSHQINDIPLIEEKMIRSHLTLGNNIWIGANCTINNGITIADNAIIGANSFVNKPVDKNAIVGGVPAKLIRYR